MTAALQQSEALVQARIDIATLQTAVEGQGREIGELKAAINTLTVTVNAMRDQISQAQGGWKVLLMMGGASAALGSAATWAMQHLTRS